MSNQNVNEYFTADDPNYAERLNNPNILTDVFTIKPKITLPAAFKAGVYPDHEHKTKAHFSIVQVKNNTCTNTGDGFTATNNNQSFTLRVYPNFSSFKWWNKITWGGEGTVTCQMKDTSTGTVLINDITSGSNLNSHDIPHKQVDIIFTLQNGARVTNISFEYENQPKLIGTEWSVPKDNITGLNDVLNTKADQATVDAGLALKLNTSSYTANDVLTKIKTVDGPGSGLDADLLDGLNSTAFLLNSNYITDSSAGWGFGHVQFKNHLTIAWGTVSIIPVANTPTKTTVAFPVPFNTTPAIIVSPVTQYPYTEVLGVSSIDATTTQVDIYITRTNTVSTLVRWIAVGR